MILRILVAIASLAAFSVASLKTLTIPYVWIALAAAFASLLLMRASRSTASKATWLNLAIAALTLGASEAYLAYRATLSVQPVYLPANYQVQHDVLGAAPVPGIGAAASLTGGGETVYDVRYTIGKDGLRLSPPFNEPAEGSVVFFGCSFTFGEGLDDDEAMPYRVGLLTNGAYQIRNFGFHGYGASQMFSALQSGLVDNVLDRAPTVVIYQALPDHVARAAGIYDFVVNHPRFALKDGAIVRQGTFLDLESARTPPSPLEETVVYNIRKSAIARLLMARPRKLTDVDEQLWLALVVQSRDMVAEKFPDAAFHVLMWSWAGTISDDQPELSERMTAGLVSAGVTIHSVEDILPNHTANPAPYQLSPLYDHHPNAAANDLIARYVVREILGNRAPSGD